MPQGKHIVTNNKQLFLITVSSLLQAKDRMQTERMKEKRGLIKRKNRVQLTNLYRKGNLCSEGKEELERKRMDRGRDEGMKG